MRSIKKIAILGVGFMGGSLSKAINKRFPKISVWGYARSRKSYSKLKKLDVVNKVSMDIEACLKDADIVILALPVNAIIDYFKKISPFLKSNAIVFDLGSSKKLIERYARKILPKSINFIGCHPLCGSEKSGAEFSQPNIYKDSICVLTSSPKSKSAGVVKKLWESLGAKVVFTEPDYHDKALSSLSHLPHLISFAYAISIPDNYLIFSLESFKGLARIANSPASVWTDIFTSNKVNLLADLNKFRKVLKKFEAALKKKDKIKIASLIGQTHSKNI